MTQLRRASLITADSPPHPHHQKVPSLHWTRHASRTNGEKSSSVSFGVRISYLLHLANRRECFAWRIKNGFGTPTHKDPHYNTQNWQGVCLTICNKHYLDALLVVWGPSDKNTSNSLKGSSGSHSQVRYVSGAEWTLQAIPLISFLLKQVYASAAIKTYPTRIWATEGQTWERSGWHSPKWKYNGHYCWTWKGLIQYSLLKTNASNP